MKKVIFLIIAASVSLTSCTRYTSIKSLDNISLFMSKETVLEKMNNKGTARGAIVNKYGQTIEVREHTTRDWFSPYFDEKTYWLYFCDGKLVQWGRAGDWAEAQKMIYDFNFNINSNSVTG